MYEGLKDLIVHKDFAGVHAVYYNGDCLDDLEKNKVTTCNLGL